MSKSLKGTKTEKNLLTAFAGESQARNRYTYFSIQAKKDEYEQIAAIFLETAENEREHGENFFKFLEGGEVKIEASFPAGEIKSTLENLEAAAAGENHEWTIAYQDFATTARTEGFKDVADKFEAIAKVERFHEARYRRLIDNIKKDKVFKTKDAVKWHCRNCGYIHEGTEPPKECPSCGKPYTWYEILAENYDEKLVWKKPEDSIDININDSAGKDIVKEQKAQGIGKLGMQKAVKEDNFDVLPEEASKLHVALAKEHYEKMHKFDDVIADYKKKMEKMKPDSAEYLKHHKYMTTNTIEKERHRQHAESHLECKDKHEAATALYKKCEKGEMPKKSDIDAIVKAKTV